MKYMLLIVNEPADVSDPEGTVSPEADPTDWVAEMTRRRVRLHGDRLRPASDATTVQVRDGEVLITDGPFAETKDQIAGYDVLECADLDEAIEVASKHPNAKFGKIEVRPFWPM